MRAVRLISPRESHFGYVKLTHQVKCLRLRLINLFVLTGILLWTAAGYVQEESSPDKSRWVNVGAVNMRGGPGMEFDVVEVLHANTPVRIVGQEGGWIEVESASGESPPFRGWVYERYLSERPLTPEELAARSQSERRSASPSEDSERSVLILLGVAGVIFLIWVLNRVRLHFAKKRTFQEIKELGTIVAERIKTCFLVEPCPRCHEIGNRLLQISPNARSVQLECTTCGRKYWAPASNPYGFKLGDEYRAFHEEVQKLVRLVGHESANIEISFGVPPGPMPFEQTTREVIPENVRAEVWRRDEGRCVKCGSRENLQFDHIIPVSKGGATTPTNLQLLCRSCNLAKGNKI